LADGSYSFTTLRPGTYVITETQPAGLLDGQETAGTPGGTVNNTVSTSQTISANTLNAGIDGTNNNFGDLRPTSIGGFIYSDTNNDGVFDVSESGIDGETVTLTGTDDLGAPVSIVTMTAGGGAYSFTNLRPGTYVITETQPVTYLDGLDTIGTPGGTSGNDVFSAITLVEGDAGADNNFGELEGTSIRGNVYADRNNDGVIDLTEPRIAGITITLVGIDDLGTAVNATTLTGPLGAYAFTNLRPGTYDVSETQPAGYLDGKDTLGAPGGGVIGADTFTGIAVAPNIAATNYNFGELEPSSVTGLVYDDLNNNAAFDGVETGISGVTVELTGTDDLGNLVSLSTLTIGDGTFSFTNLRPGSYTVAETQPVVYLDGKETTGSLGGSIAVNDQIGAFTLPSNTAAIDYIFGELTRASLSGFAYIDADNDGVFDLGETPQFGTIITLTGTDDLGSPVSVFIGTLMDGSYTFTDLRPGTYVITETQPVGLLDGQETAGTPGGTVNNTVATSQTISAITLNAGVNGTNNNFGDLRPATIGGFVYSDLDNDGVFDLTESGISGATITLTGADDLGNAVNTGMLTAGDGSYGFTNLRPGTYVITETQPVGFLDGLDTIGTPGGTSANDVFSTITLVEGAAGAGNNFGELAPASLSGSVFIDTDNDGFFDLGESGIAGVTVALTGTDDLGNAVSLSTMTVAGGGYTFTNLRPGTYALTETQPAGYFDGLDTVGTLGGMGGNDNLTAIPVVAADNGTDYVFGELRPASLNGFVYVDANNDGVFDVSETGIAGTTVTLTGTDDLGNSVNIPTISVAGGAYSFTNLRPGMYEITETQPAGYLDGIDTIGTPGGTAGNDTLTGITLIQGTGGVDNNFGELSASSISGTVFVDHNNNGIQNPRDRGIAGVTVQLTGMDDLGGTVSLTVITDENGNYSFTGLRPSGNGGYTLMETQPRRYRDGKDTPGSAGGDSTINDVISGITLGSATDATSYNFGERLRITPETPPTRPPFFFIPEEDQPEPSEPFIFAFDAFNNFAFDDDDEPLPTLGPIDIWRPALLPLQPIYSGEADPGSTLIVSLYNANGVHLSSQTVIVDAGGNWLANFASVTMRDTPSDVRITQMNAPYSFGESSGNNLRTYYAPAALNPGHFLSQRSGGGLTSESAPLLAGLDISRPIGLGFVKYGSELLPSEGVAAGE